MNRIHKIKAIDGLKAFTEFRWDGDPASQYNLIYGWNGSGKTTLSRILSFYEHGSVELDEFEGVNVRLKTNDGVLSEGDLNTEYLEVRVFNEDFIENNLSFRESSAEPIVIIGQDNVDTEKQIEKLETSIEKKIEKVRAINKRLEDIPKTEPMLTESARRVTKEFAETPLASTKYAGRSYTKATVKKRFENKVVTRDNINSLVIDDRAKLEGLRDQVLERHSKVAAPNIKTDKIRPIFEKGNKLLQLEIETESIERLKEDEDLRKWVKQGHDLHTDREQSKCLFCEKNLPSDLLSLYGRFFTEEVEAAESKIDSLESQLQSLEKMLMSEFPDSSKFFSDLGDEYAELKEEVSDKVELISAKCNRLRERLNRRRGRLQMEDSREEVVAFPAEDVQHLKSYLTEINKLCKKQNKRLDKKKDQTEEAARNIELHIVASHLIEKDYFKWKEKRSSLIEDRKKLKRGIENQRAKLSKKRGALRDTAIAVDEINAVIAEFLGEGQIELGVAEESNGKDEEGYYVENRGERTQYLSDGEKSIVALSYFLVSLREEDCDLENTVVVIDDPVDSQDAVYLFQTFGLLKRYMRDAGQLFLLTHNYELFNLARDWLKSEQYYEDSTLYWMEMKRESDEREAVVEDLPPLIENHKSEYQYLFSCLYEFKEGGSTLAEPLIPNIARKVLENFAAFKWSCRSSERLASIVQNRFIRTENKLKRSVGDAVLKFVHEYSHGQNFDRPITASVMESENICDNVLEFIRLSDDDHYNSLKGEINRYE